MVIGDQTRMSTNVHIKMDLTTEVNRNLVTVLNIENMNYYDNIMTLENPLKKFNLFQKLQLKWRTDASRKF